MVQAGLRLAYIDFDEPTHTYAVVRADASGREQRHVPRWSVTGVLKAAGYIRFPGVAETTLEDARTRGGRVHRALQFYSEGTLDWTTVAACDRGYIESGVRLLETGEFDVLRQEFRVWHPTWDYVGTGDLLVWWCGGLAVLDYKTGDPADVAAHLQTAAYAEGLRAMIAAGVGPVEVVDADPKAPIRRASIELRANGRRARLHPYVSPQHVQDWPLFQAAVMTVREIERIHGRIEEASAA